MYYIHPNQGDKSFLFLKNPENVINGKRISAIIAPTSFSSETIEPKNNPIDAPQKDIKQNMTQCKKNCPPVSARLTIK